MRSEESKSRGFGAADLAQSRNVGGESTEEAKPGARAARHYRVWDFGRVVKRRRTRSATTTTTTTTDDQHYGACTVQCCCSGVGDGKTTTNKQK